GKNSLNRLIRCVCGKKIGPDPRNFNQRVSLGRNDLLIRTFPNAAVAFSGHADAINDNLLAIASSTNTTTATGVGIEILDNTSAILKPDGNSFSTNQNLIPGTNVLHFSARYKGTGTSASAGQANADATFIMRYE
ncbi:type 1 fimbrial major subunit FimA, partial [Escherichia coli]|uniref:type 1 fimbrial major subunit FimA n=1 Tax=Escherichia coli TaxID=562 RepID=UPI00214CA5FA